MNVQIRNVSDAALTVLTRRAAAAGQSLQDYLRALLDEHAATPTVGEVMERVGDRSGSTATADDVVDSVRADRASH